MTALLALERLPFIAIAIAAAFAFAAMKLEAASS
jgi:hypothetical protein